MTSADLQATIAHMGAAARAASAPHGGGADRGARTPRCARWRAACATSAAALQRGQRRATSTPRAAAGLAAPLVDRLKLDADDRSRPWPHGCEQIAAMPDPIGEIIELRARPSGIRVGRCACRSACSA